MTSYAYGIRHKRIDGTFTTDNDLWIGNSQKEAQDLIDRLGEGRTLIAREVGEAFEVLTPPTAPGSVILHSNYGHLVLDIDGHWGSYTVSMLEDELTKPSQVGFPEWTWTVIFDAATAAAQEAVAE